MEAEDVDGDVVADPDVPNDDVVTLKISQLHGVWNSGGSVSWMPGTHSSWQPAQYSSFRKQVAAGSTQHFDSKQSS